MAVFVGYGYCCCWQQAKGQISEFDKEAVSRGVFGSLGFKQDSG